MFVLVCGRNNTLHNCMSDDANINDLQISIFRRAASFTNPMIKTKWLSETNSNFKYYGKRISDSKLHNLRMTIQFRIDHPKNEKKTNLNEFHVGPWVGVRISQWYECHESIVIFEFSISNLYFFSLCKLSRKFTLSQRKYAWYYDAPAWTQIQEIISFSNRFASFNWITELRLWFSIVYICVLNLCDDCEL